MEQAQITRNAKKRYTFARFLAVAIGLSASLPVRAADIPVYKSPVTAGPQWTGAYLGLSLGARWTSPEWNTTCLSPGAPFATCPDAGVPALFATNNPSTFDSTAFKGGLYLGYNWQVGRTWVVGVEGDVAFANNSKTNAGIPGTQDLTVAGSPGLDSSSIKQTWDASARLRGGYLVTPTTLLYVTGGVAMTHIEASATCGTFFPVGWCFDPANIGRTDSQTTNRYGWTLGGGLEAIVWGNWLARVEYRYADYGTWSPTFMQGPTSSIDTINTDIKVRTHTAQVGIAYKFLPR